MRHSYRSFRVTDLAGAAELVDLLVVTAETPSRCAGYRLQSGHGSLLFLCDDGHDTLRDYAVFDERTQCQIECVTFSRCLPHEALAIVDALLERRNTVRIESRFPSLVHQDADCPHCGARVLGGVAP